MDRQDGIIGVFSSFGITEEEEEEEDSIGFAFTAVPPSPGDDDLEHDMEGGKVTMGPFVRLLMFLYSFGTAFIAISGSKNNVNTDSLTMLVGSYVYDRDLDDPAWSLEIVTNEL